MKKKFSDYKKHCIAFTGKRRSKYYRFSIRNNDITSYEEENK